MYKLFILILLCLSLSGCISVIENDGINVGDLVRNNVTGNIGIVCLPTDSTEEKDKKTYGKYMVRYFHKREALVNGEKRTVTVYEKYLTEDPSYKLIKLEIFDFIKVN